jgi:single-strand DNA-binding protein
MPNFNKVMLMGNLVSDPVQRTTTTDRAVTKFSLALNRKWKDRSGNQQEEATFVDCEAWDRTAEVINQYMSKGKPIFVEGRLKLDRWETQSGDKRSRLLVVVENFQFIDAGGGGGGNGGGGGGRGYDRDQDRGRGYDRSAPASSEPSGGYADESPAYDPGDDVPF